ncbi:NAD(P)-dependent dehydrogenase, short-chain alcohol dehydrogenase family [Chitinophaga sp. YR573]|uniref:SDR family NAD(P)-dependent oxidoreductase n=1 Tax=Chitinophaga sp. YR573 TaxID=1881040 RepID=UPI0008C09DD7|nr:SDR family NAD(P)-dependent oxidoreductase [Chitinophaga sp. YR573]SEW44033.1 NAD(P)-dependent dehydrogenase, short-chain alcohol dehydrogenase family [Chitinophaga sp. YR573]
MNDKIVLITGATGGIGKAVAIALAKQDFTVVIHGRNRQKTEQVCEEIKATTGNDKVDMIVANLFSLQDVRNMANTFKQKYKRLDVLVNNAGGIMGKDRETTPGGIEKTMAINLLAPFLLTELLLDILKNSNDGRIINVSSNSHKLNAKPDFDDLSLEKGYNPLRAYGNAKLFLIWITQHLSQTLKQQGIKSITANTVHPGAVATNFGVESNLGAVLNFIAKLARPLFKTPEQGADTIVYLATSGEVNNISGKYFVNRKQASVTETYYSEKTEKAVWNYCMENTKVFRS